MAERPTQCPKCGGRLLHAGVKYGRDLLICEMVDDQVAPCEYRGLFHQIVEAQVCCPHCGCNHVLDGEVTHTEMKTTGRRRRRICRNCKLPIFTKEVVEA